MFDLVSDREMELFSHDCDMESIERANSLQCIRILKNILSRRNEKKSGNSTLYHMVEMARNDSDEIRQERKGLFLEFYMLSRGSLGMSDLHYEEMPEFIGLGNQDGARIRSDFLDKMVIRCEQRMKSYISGLEPSVIRRREDSRRRILDLLGGNMNDWKDFRWQRKNVFTDSSDISEIVDLTEDEVSAIDRAVENRLPFGITPYYLSLFDRDSSRKWDHAVRAQVIPPLTYVNYQN